MNGWFAPIFKQIWRTQEFAKNKSVPRRNYKRTVRPLNYRNVYKQFSETQKTNKITLFLRNTIFFFKLPYQNNNTVYHIQQHNI